MEDVLLKQEGEYAVPYFDNKAIIYQTGPYGFWYVKLEKGITPKEFKGAFTDPEAALVIVKGHTAKKTAPKN